MVANKLIRKGYKAFLAYVWDASKVDSFVDSIRTVRELPRLPLDQEVEFGIKMLSGTISVSIAPYYMTPKEVNELKVQL